MSISAQLLPLWLSICGWLLAGTALLFALRRVNWRQLQANRKAQHMFFAISLGLVLFWQIRAGLSPGMGIRFMAMTALTLLMGWPLALLAGGLGLLGLCLFGVESWQGAGVVYCLTVLLPVALSFAVLYWVQRKLPHNPFIYLFVCAFFNGALCMFAVASATALMLGLSGVYSWELVYEQYYQYLPLMLFPEAFVNGALISTVFGTVPHWLSSFDQDSYFRD